MDTSLIAVISSGLVAILSLFFNYRTSMKSSKMQIISPMRQIWINNLRDKLSEFNILIYNLGLLIELKKESGLSNNEQKDYISEAIRLRIEVELLLNPNEKIHNELLSLLEKTITIPLDKELKNIHESCKILLDKTKEVLKKEWIVVKEGN